MNTYAILLCIYIGFLIGVPAGILLSHALRQMKEDERIPEKDVEKWIKEQELSDN